MIEWLYILLGLLTLLYIFLTWNHDYWKKRGVHYQKPLPAVGNMLDVLLLKRNALYIYLDLYRKFLNQPVCGVFEFLTPMLLVRSPDLIQTVLAKDFASFHDNDFLHSEEIDPYLAKNPFLSTGTDWKTNRAALSPAFTAGKLKAMFPKMKEVSQQLEEYLEGHLNEKVEAKELGYLFATDIIANCAFGIRGNSFIEEDHVFKRMGKTMAERFHNPFIGFAFFTVPKLSQILKLRLIPEAVYMYLKDAILQVNDFRRKNNIVSNDFAEFMLTAYNNRKKEGDNSDVALLGHAITFFMEGIETSTIVASFTLYELARNPYVQENLRDEISSNFATLENLDFETLHKLPYLHKVVSETMRKYPPGMALKKLCTQTTTLDVEGKPLKIEKGTPIVISIYGLHHDPEYFPNPQEFDPERFSEENISSRPHFAYIPFGEGPRMCVGFRFALTQIKLFIISILMKYKVQCSEKTSKEVILNKLDMFPTSTEGLWIKLEKKDNI